MSTDRATELDIAQAASAPKRMRVGSEEVEAHDLEELLKADEYLAKRQAMARGALGIRILKTRGSGAV